MFVVFQNGFQSLHFHPINHSVLTTQTHVEKPHSVVDLLSLFSNAKTYQTRCTRFDNGSKTAAATSGQSNLAKAASNPRENRDSRLMQRFLDTQTSPPQTGDRRVCTATPREAACKTDRQTDITAIIVVVVIKELTYIHNLCRLYTVENVEFMLLTASLRTSCFKTIENHLTESVTKTMWLIYCF